MASRRVCGPDGRQWLIRERWLPGFGGRGLEARDLALPRPAFSPVALLLAPFALLVLAVRLLPRIPLALFQALFLPPWIEAIHEGPPYSKMTWRAADRQVGPRVIEQIAAAIVRGDRRIVVEGARFLGFSNRP